MIKKIHLQNFVVHKDLVLNFEKGMTSIVGRNGGGKSLIQEAIRFALFGSAALRGKLEDYDKKLKVTLTCEINSKEYEIVRTLRDCNFDGIVGTTACNQAINKALGFDMSVFDMGCCAKQMEITRLGDMKPTERKNAIDKIIGLEVLDELRKEVKENLSQLRGRKEALSSLISEPIEPEKPLGYETSEKLSADLINATALDSKRKVLLNTIENAEKVEPIEPTFDLAPPPGDPKNEGLENMYRRELQQMELQGFNKPREFEYSLEVLQEDVELERLHKPFEDLCLKVDRSEEYCESLRLQWIKYEMWEKAPKQTCPKCEHTFVTQGGVEEVQKPEISKQDIESMLQQHKKLNAFNELKPRLTELTSEELQSRIREQSTYQKGAQKYAEMKDVLSKLEPCDYEAWREYLRKKNSYDSEYMLFATRLNSYKKGQEALLEMVEVVSESSKYGNLSEMQTVLNNAITYEANLVRYAQEKERYETLRIDLENVTKDYDSYKAADLGLVELKKRVKMYVIPSLQQVSNELIKQMSDGELNECKITEDFEITVDGKELSLLSGSEKAVANLAIRLGLGCVLTRKVFNVFMGDEIDDSMSVERANLVSDSLKKLLNQIDQIILISHKEIETEHQISVDNLKN